MYMHLVIIYDNVHTCIYSNYIPLGETLFLQLMFIIVLLR